MNISAYEYEYYRRIHSESIYNIYMNLYVIFRSSWRAPSMYIVQYVYVYASRFLIFKNASFSPGRKAPEAYRYYLNRETENFEKSQVPFFLFNLFFRFLS